jgi:hypothetical protein
VAGRSTSAAAIVAQPGTAGENFSADERTSKSITVNIQDSFIRTSGDCIGVASGREMGIQLSNALVAADGSLLHALGSSRIDRFKTVLRLKIDRTLARTRGGLVYLESTLEETELPLTNIEASSSVFSTAGQSPLFRVDGQGQMERLHDRIFWNAAKVVYDEIATYRRDQVLQTGVFPRDYSRSEWMTSFDPRDESPLIETVRFRKPLEPQSASSSLSRDDLRIDGSSAASDRGPNMKLIPAAPPADS